MKRSLRYLAITARISDTRIKDRAPLFLMKKLSIFKILAFALLLASCNKDDVITENRGQKPVIELGSETGVYTIKVGRELTIAPTYRHADHALFAWTVDGKLLSSDPVLKHVWDREQELYVKLRVDTPDGYAEEELKVEVMALTPPLISLVIPSQGLKVVQDTQYAFAPDIQNDDLEGFTIEWVRNGTVVGTERTYVFQEKVPGTYPVTVNASNIDGRTSLRFDVEVVEKIPYEVRFPTPSHAQAATDRFTFAGRPVFLRPLLEYFDNPEYAWSVDGQPAGDVTGRVFKFTPTEAGVYVVSVTVTEGSAKPARLTRNITQGETSVTATVTVVCVDQTEDGRYRPAAESSSRCWNKVYEYTPAPGQFINEQASAGFAGNETTPEQAVAYATQRMTRKAHVSLGSFGGYIIVGFDHSIVRRGDEYDFAVQGNAFDDSNEPGVVWVMQDTNGNGEPDDEWYELKGSETGVDGTIQDYEVTYFKPAPGAHTPWADSEGNTGRVDKNAYHTQEYYYPLWIKEESYTLRGTRISPRNNQDPTTGFWNNRPYDWGYADNMGADNLAEGSAVDGGGQRNGFRISNAIYHDGTPADLKYIDFIKVQCGVLAQSGWLGEISTEVFSFEDLSIENQETDR